MQISTILEDELKGSVDFFLDYTNQDQTSKGFGLTADSTKKPQLASIASSGFALSAWIIACERKYLPRQRALDLTRKTLYTLYNHASHHRGFFAHFLHMDSAQRFKTCEYSTIDTSLCLNGVITAAAYFDDLETSEIAQRILERVDWNFLVFEQGDRTLFHMAYNPDRNGDYVHGEPGFISQWDMAAEQKMMYLQAASRVQPETAQKLYHGFSRDTGSFGGSKIIINPGGNLFAYQFSEAWMDFRSYLDPDGLDWFANTQLAALANRQFCLENRSQYRTYHENSWGLSAGDSPKGYAVFGSSPSLQNPHHNGTVSIYAALACLPFLPDLTRELVDYLYHHQPQTWGKYGFYDAYNLDVTPPWYSSAIYGIDKGCSMIMIENALSGLVWETYTNSPLIQKSLKILGFTSREGERHE